MNSVFLKFWFSIVFCLCSISIFAIVPQPPKHRIIALAPNLAEIVYAAGAGQYLVGVSSATDYPVLAKKIPVVANYNGCDIEKVLSLKPDLVIAWSAGTSYAEVKQLRALHIPVYIAQFNQVQDIARVIADVGRLAGTEKAARKFTKNFLQRYRLLKQKYAHRRSVKVFYQLSLQPLMTLNNRTLIGKVIEDCGGKNIFSHAWGVAPQISLENVLEANPEVILMSDNKKGYRRAKHFWSKCNELQAIRHHFLFNVNPDWIERYGPRILNGMAQICEDIDRARR